MFHLEPVGRHLIEVCTNVSCALVGAQQVLEAFESELGVRAGETTEDGEFTLRTIECVGGCGWATIVAVDERYRSHVRAETCRRHRRGAAAWPLSCGRSSSRRRRPRPATPRTLRGDRRLQGAEARAQAEAGGRDRRAQGVEPPRPRRRVLRHRAQVELRAQARPAPEAALPRRQRRRVGAGHLQGRRDHGARAAPADRGRA